MPSRFSEFDTKTAQLKPQLIGGKPVGYLQSVVDMTKGSPKTNPQRGQSMRFEPETSACKSSTLTVKIDARVPVSHPNPEANGEALGKRLHVPFYC